MTVRRAREVTLLSGTADAPRRVMRGFSYSSHSFLGFSLVVTQHSPLGRRAVPGSCVGGTCGSGGGYGVFPASVATHCATVTAVGTSVEGNAGTVSSGAAKLSALVRSPTTPRRHADRFGTSAPNRVSRKRSSDV